jgi:hypothetical protein
MSAWRTALQIGGGPRVPALGAQLRGQGLGAFGAVVPHRHFIDGPHARMRGRQHARDAAGAQHQQAARILAREERGAERRSRGGAARGDLVAVHHRQRHAGVRVVQHVGRMQAGQAACAVAGKDVDGLDAEKPRVAPRRHDEHGALAAALCTRLDAVHMARRHLRLGREGRAQCGHELVETQGRAGGGFVEVLHGVGERIAVSKKSVSACW